MVTIIREEAWKLVRVKPDPRKVSGLCFYITIDGKTSGASNPWMLIDRYLPESFGIRVADEEET